MKKLLLGFLLVSNITFAQTIQLVIGEMNKKINTGYDTTINLKIQPQKFVEKDSALLNNEYKNFFNDVLLNYSDTINRFVLQATEKQSGTEPRIIITKPNGTIVIVNYSSLSATRKEKYNQFLDKIKTTL